MATKSDVTAIAVDIAVVVVVVGRMTVRLLLASITIARESIGRRKKNVNK